MNLSGAVLSAFRRSAPLVDKLDRGSGTFSRPEVPLVEEVCDALWRRKGKRLRSRLVFWFGEMCDVPPARLEIYAWAAEAIHTASLLHDDVVDRADVRRGEPSANALYDNTVPVLSGDYLFSDAIHQVALQGNVPILQGLCRTVKELAQGECLQYQNRFHIAPDEKVFLDICRLKTTSLLLWAGQVGPWMNPVISMKAVQGFFEGFGNVFQFSDDLLDVVGCPTKERWSDLREGKLNWVTWRMLQRNTPLKTLAQRDFSRRNVSDELLAAFTRAAKRGEHHEAQRELGLWVERTQAWLGELPPSETREALSGLVRLCVDRTQ